MEDKDLNIGKNPFGISEVAADTDTSDDFFKQLLSLGEEPPADIEKQKPEPENTKEKEEDTKIDHGNILEKLMEDEPEEEEPKNTKPEKKEEKKEVSKPKAKVEEEEPEENDGGEKGSASNPLSALAKDLVRLGVFTEDEEGEEFEINSEEDFLKRFEYEKQKGVATILNNFLGRFGKRHVDAFKAIYIDGIDPEEYFSKEATVNSVNNLDLSDERNQETVVRRVLLSQGFEKEDVEKEIERLKNYGDLEETAQRYKKVLVKKEEEELKKLEEKKKQELSAKQEMLNRYVETTERVIDEALKKRSLSGIPLTPALADELKEFLLKPEEKDPNGIPVFSFDKYLENLRDSKNIEEKVKTAFLLHLINKDPELKFLQRMATTKSSTTLFSELSKTKIGTKGAQGQKQSSIRSWFEK
jgi:hypothetical protein